MQSKEVFSSDDIVPFASQLTTEAIDVWAKNHPSELQRLSKYLKDICEMRSKLDGEKIKIRDNYTASALSDKPAKYLPPNNKKVPFEVLIVEGDSAYGNIRNNRNLNTQGLYPIRGKIPNAIVTPVKKFFENAEIAGMFNIFGYNEKTFNPNRIDPAKFKPEKVIMATDADPDGFK